MSAPVRHSQRGSTIAASQQSLDLAEANRNAPPRAHVSATGRAIQPIPSQPTAQANEARLAQAAAAPADSRPVMVVYGGPASPGGHLQGMPLTGPHIDRGTWGPDLTTLRDRLGDMLQDAGHGGAPHAGGMHYAENAHHRQQGTGGFTGTAGAAPASVGSNVDDMMAEDSHARISTSLPSNQVREVNVAGIRPSGPDAGTLDTRTRYLFARPDTDEEYRLAYQRLQDGQRNMPDKNEARAVRDGQTKAALHAGGAAPAASASSSSSAGQAAPFSISSTAEPQSPPAYTARTKNDSGKSFFFSAIRSPGLTWRTGEDAAEWHASFDHHAARRHSNPAAAASAEHADTGSRTPPFIAPPSPLTLPSLRPGSRVPIAPPPSPDASPATSPRSASASSNSASAAAAAGHAPAAPQAPPPVLQRRKTI